MSFDNKDGIVLQQDISIPKNIPEIDNIEKA